MVVLGEVQQHHAVDAALMGPGAEHVGLRVGPSLHETDHQLVAVRRGGGLDPGGHRGVEGLPRDLLRIPDQHQADVPAAAAAQGLGARVRGPPHLMGAHENTFAHRSAHPRLVVEGIAHRRGRDAEVARDGGDGRTSRFPRHGCFRSVGGTLGMLSSAEVTAGRQVGRSLDGHMIGPRSAGTASHGGRRGRSRTIERGPAHGVRPGHPMPERGAQHRPDPGVPHARDQG